MEIYLVGGAVRDELLGLPVRERDWVVVGARPEDLEKLNYRRVGRSFPVFLHPETGEEYALARTEQKTAPGYRGFSVRADPSVTLEEDLQRRDLTVNAMAKTPDGAIIDPWGGRNDLADRKLRHVSEAFREDPVRILRAARFAARFHQQGFELAEETLQLMREMVDAGEANALVAERVWRETENALTSDNPEVFFTVLRACGALAVVYPEIDALFGLQQTAVNNAGEHLLRALAAASRLSPEPEVRFAVLCHALSKAETLSPQQQPEERSVARTQALCERLGTPNRYRELALQVARYCQHSHAAAELPAARLLAVLEALDAFRRPQRLDQFLMACAAEARVNEDSNDDYPQAELIRRAQAAAKQVTARELAAQGLTGAELGDALRRERIAAISAVLGRA